MSLDQSEPVSRRERVVLLEDCFPFVAFASFRIPSWGCPFEASFAAVDLPCAVASSSFVQGRLIGKRRTGHLVQESAAMPQQAHSQASQGLLLSSQGLVRQEAGSAQ